jgi:hypothetical protein
LALINDTLVLEFIQEGPIITKSKLSSGLGDSRAIGVGGFYFAVKVNFEGESRGVKNCAAIRAVTQVALHFARDFGP